MVVRKLLALSIACCLSGAPLYAMEAFTVKHVDIEGLNRITADAVADELPIRDGEKLTSAISNQVISDLYDTGYFSRIDLYRQQDDTLLIQVKELPAIGSVSIEGNDAIKTEQLQKVLVQAGVQVGNMLNASTLAQVKQSLEQAYFNMGKYAVRVNIKQIPMSRNRVKLAFHISEGLSAKVQRITFVGNKAFDSDTLANQLVLTTPGLFTFFNHKDVFAQDKLRQSLEGVSRYYMDRGYIDFHVNSAVAALTPTHNDVVLTIGVTEGGKYTFKGYKLEGKLILPKADVESMIRVKSGEVFSRQKVIDSAKDIGQALGNKGYAFANINPVPVIDKKNKTVEIVFHVNPGKQVYVRDIAFSGNTVTNDKVLRQQMRFVEGSRFNHNKVESSKIFVRRAYPFITDIQDSVQPVSGTEDQVDVLYKVKERSANTVSANVGFSDLDGFIVGGNLKMPNLFGTGNIFNINASLSRPVKSLSVQYTEPFFTLDGVSQSISMYLTNVDNGQRDLIDFSTNSVGGNLSYSIPVTSVDKIDIGTGVDYTNLIQPSYNTSATVRAFTQEHGDNYMTYTADLGWSRNTTNQAWFPTKGMKASLGGKLAVPGSTMPWYKLLSSLTWFMPVWGDTAFSLGGHVNYGNGYGNNSTLPLFNNFYGGGWGTVRGFEAGSLGPKDTILCGNDPNSGCTGTREGQALGGNLAVNASANFYFPVPFTHNSPNYRLGVFADMGNVYDTEKIATVWDVNNQPTSPSFSNLRYSAGIAFQWVSPLGPLSFSLAMPLNKKTGDRTQLFQFTLGSTF